MFNYEPKEQKPSWWIDACTEAIKEALQKKIDSPEDIVAIGVSGQQHGMVTLDN
ncbi:MAG: hypothetical protein GY786_20815 [Proteobacteria bacterium]|nr:hypothetical protein [Pseudomonadota bacterium]